MGYGQIAKIIEELRPLDAHQAYYVKDEVQLGRIGPLVPPIAEILKASSRFARRPARTAIAAASILG